jgi:hypothetical protein
MFFLLFWPLLQLATVSGKVTSAQTGEPIAHAQVWIEPDGLPDEARHALTDAEGNYEIRDLNPGDYGIRCVKAGYIQGQATPDHRWPTRSTPITLAEKQIVKDADCKLSRGGSISGSVTDQDGEPLSGVEVQLMIRNYQHGRAELEREEEMQTDDHGHYRFYDLPAGRYYIGAGGRMGNPNELNYNPIVYPNGSRLAERTGHGFSGGRGNRRRQFDDAARQGVSGRRKSYGSSRSEFTGGPDVAARHECTVGRHARNAGR